MIFIMVLLMTLMMIHIHNLIIIIVVYLISTLFINLLNKFCTTNVRRLLIKRWRKL